MIDIALWTEKFLQVLEDTFGERVWFAGLQGSYGRGEATQQSDIDLVVILDELSACDIEAYNNMLDALPHRELACGFLSGKEEILNWEPSDLFQLYYDTTPLKGNLNVLLDKLDKDAVNRAIKLGACTIYHGCVHNMLYEKSEKILGGLYKTASFVVQAICFKQTGRYIRHQEELAQAVCSDERVIINTFMSLKKGEKADFKKMSEALLIWAQGWIDKT